MKMTVVGVYSYWVKLVPEKGTKEVKLPRKCFDQEPKFGDLVNVTAVATTKEEA